MALLEWPTEDVPLASSRLRAAELLERVGADLERWEEDGLGAASGGFLVLPSGRPVQVRELAHLVDQGIAGAGLHVDAADLLDLGVDALLAEVMDWFALSDVDLVWRQAETAEMREATARLVRAARATKGSSRPRP